MGNTKIFAVDVTCQLYVVANDETEAEQIALSSAKYEIDNAFAFTHEVTSVDDIDPSWRDALPYGDRRSDDETLRVLLDKDRP